MSIVQAFSNEVETGVHGLARGCGKRRPVHRRSAVLSAVALYYAAPLLAEPSERPIEASPPPTASSQGPSGSEAQPSPPTDATPTSFAANAPPAGAPPEVQAADPKWNERDPSSDVQLEPSASQGAPTLTVALGAQLFGVSGKVMSGLTLRIGRELYWGELEFSPVWLTQSSADVEGHFLGNQWGLYFSLAPLRTRYVELLLGVGADVYHLWEIHGDEVLAALSFRAQSHFHVSEHATVFLNLRSYALHSEGLELGVRRDASKSVPLLGAVGAEWRFE